MNHRNNCLTQLKLFLFSSNSWWDVLRVGSWAATLEEQLDANYSPGAFACSYSLDFYVSGFPFA